MEPDPYVPPRESSIAPEAVSGSPVFTSAIAIRKRCIRHEVTVRSIGSVLVLFGGLLIFSGGSQVFNAKTKLAAFLVATYVLCGAFALIAGLGLRKLNRKARIAACLLGGFLFLGFPTTTFLGAYLLYLMTSEKGSMVFSEDYQLIITQTPEIREKIPLIVWIIALLILAVFLLLMPLLGSA